MRPLFPAYRCSCISNLPRMSDALTIEKWLSKRLGAWTRREAIRGQRHNLTTNRCEASHLTVLKSTFMTPRAETAQETLVPG